MKISGIAEFKTGLPDDAVYEDDDVVVFPGRGVAEIIAGMLTRLGYRVTPPAHAHEHGWELNAYAAKRRVWLQVSWLGEDEVILTTEELPTLFQRLLRRREAIHAELLSGLHREMLADSRFQDIKWWRNYREGRPAKEPVSPD